MKIAFVYDRVNKFGGAERVLLALKEAFPDSVLFTSVYDKEKTPWIGNWDVRTSFLQHIPFARTHHEWFGWLMPFAFECLDLSAFDVVVSITSEAAKGVITHPNQVHLCYCLTPTRYLWSHTHEYGKGRFQWIKQLVFTKLRQWDYVASQRPDIMIAISKRVEGRIEKYYRRQAQAVVYPPVKIEHEVTSTLPLHERDYYLVVSRLVPYKRVDIAIEACLEANRKLMIVGTGSDKTRLQRIAGGSSLITFRDFISDSELHTVYRNAKALLCPQEEDFGIVSVEAQSYGVPVISYEKSGVAETIQPGKTGLLFSEQTAASLERSLQNFETQQWHEEMIQKNATRFSTDRFLETFAKIIHDAVV